MNTQNATNNPAIITTENNANHLVDGPLTTAATRQAAPGLLLNEIDNRIVKIRPMSTPVDQISRMIGARPAKSMIVEYYSVDTRPIEARVKEKSSAIDAPVDSENPDALQIATTDDRIFSPTDTVMFPSINGADDQPLIGYISEVKTAPFPGIVVIPINPVKNGDTVQTPVIEPNAPIIRMGRAASELDVQTAQFEALPVKARNYCQIFKAQVEQSALNRLSDKEVGWTFSDQEEVAIMDMRLGMERSFIFGVSSRLSDPKKFDEVLFTQGIWRQAGGQIDLSIDALDQRALLEMMKQAFTGTAAGSSRKILVAGSDLVLALNSLETTKVIQAGDTVTKWGIDFHEIRSKFGTLSVVHSEVFDQCGHSTDGMIIDPQYLTKYSHIPFRVEHLDLKSSGQRNTDAIVATEASCLVLRHPKTHFRIIAS